MHSLRSVSCYRNRTVVLERRDGRMPSSVFSTSRFYESFMMGRLVRDAGFTLEQFHVHPNASKASKGSGLYFIAWR